MIEGRVGCRAGFGLFRRTRMSNLFFDITKKREEGFLKYQWFHLGLGGEENGWGWAWGSFLAVLGTVHFESLWQRNSYMQDRLVLGAELQMINCIKKKKQCLLAKLCNRLHINLREILCGISAASQEFSCRSQVKNGSLANRRSRRWSGSHLPSLGGEPNHSYSSIVMRNWNYIQHLWDSLLLLTLLLLFWT